METAAVEALQDRVVRDIPAVVELIASSTGRVVCTGLGKSGHIARKLAATLSSTGTPASFIHATEALHGDSGGLRPEDVLIAFSASGTTAEVCHFAAMANAQGTPVVAMVGRPDSRLGGMATAVLDVGVEREADPLGLAPTSSTTAALVMGDALAAALMVRREFTAEQFAGYHPGGALGERLTKHPT
ncbi:MAG TPA: SIS domain-containing protein [Jiangellaceae bacterium]|nr:SIS domain-containing protein [Jiangellaceae bacterium]